MQEHRVREERLQIMLSPEELVAVDDFRFKKRMPSPAAAVRVAAAGACSSGICSRVSGTKSTDYGVIGDAPSDASSQMRRVPRSARSRSARSLARFR